MKTFGLLARVIVVLVIVASLLSVNTFPSITNDALVYIDHSRNLAAGGFVVHGFRQAGYPFFLAVMRRAAGLFGLEPLLTAAMVQRLLLVGAGMLAFRAWGWWSLGLLVFLFTTATIAYSNLLLTEALALPGGVLVLIIAWAYLRQTRSDEMTAPYSRQVILGVLATLGAFLMFTLKFTFAVYGVVPLIMAMAGWRTRFRKLGVSLLIGFLLISAGFAVALVLENRVEVGVAAPSADAGQTEYYYAWHQVFAIEENRSNPALAEFYDEGVVFDFERQLSQARVPFAEREELFHAETSAMLEAAGQSETGSRLASVAWSLAGGRLHDVGGTIHGIIHSNEFDVERWVHLNRFAVANGPSAFADVYNDGRLPEVLITDEYGFPMPGPDSQSWAMILVPLSLTVLVVGSRDPNSRSSSLLGLTVVLATAAGLGWIRADNFRFLVVSSAFGIAAATSVLAVHHRRMISRVAKVVGDRL